VPPLERAAPAPATLALALGVAATLLYASRLCPGLCLVGDSAELVTAAALWGVPHPPGYPLYTLVAHAFTWLPLGSVPWRVHLTSALFHGAAVACAARAAFSVTGSHAASLAAGVALALARSFFLGSLYAEVFPLNDLFFAGLLAAALELRRLEGPPGRRAVLAFACLAGTASAHHMMIALSAPAILVLVARPFTISLARRPRLAAGAAAAFLAPVLLSYALIPVAAARGPELSWGDVHDAGSLLRLVTRGDYGGLWAAARHASTAPGWVRVASFCRLIVQSFGVPTLLVAAWGLSALLWEVPAVGAAFALGVLVPGPLFAWVNALDTGSPEAIAYFERFTTMAHVPVAVLLGVGVSEAWAALRSSRGSRIAAGVALAIWAAHGAERARDVDLRDDRLGAAFGRDIVDATPDGSLILLAGDAPANAALYACAVERRCGDRVVLSPGTLSLPWRMAQVRRRYPRLHIPWSEGPALPRAHEIVAAEEPMRPVFVHPDLLTKDPALARTPFVVLPAGLLFRVWPVGVDEEAPVAAFRASALAMADAGCEGCRLLADGDAPAAEAVASRAYVAAYENHAAVARALGSGASPAEGPSMTDLATSLDERAARGREAVHGHGSGSMSR
jgi:hypothetical protein